MNKIKLINNSGRGVILNRVDLSELLLEDMQNIKAESRLWCKCADAPMLFERGRYYENGKCNQCSIIHHHWHCGFCNKVLQIG